MLYYKQDVADKMMMIVFLLILMVTNCSYILLKLNTGPD